jgi:hypothetical protein
VSNGATLDNEGDVPMDDEFGMDEDAEAEMMELGNE